MLPVILLKVRFMKDLPFMKENLSGKPFMKKKSFMKSGKSRSPFIKVFMKVVM